MSLEKAEIKQIVLKGVNGDLDQMITSAQSEQMMARGAKSALADQAGKAMAIVQLIKQDLDDGELAVIDSPQSVAKYAILMVNRVVDGMRSASMHQANLELVAAGSISAFQTLHGKLTKQIESEGNLAHNIQSVSDDQGSMNDLEVSDARSRPTGVRPGKSIAQQRKEEEAAEVVKLAKSNGKKVSKKKSKKKSIRKPIGKKNGQVHA